MLQLLQMLSLWREPSPSSLVSGHSISNTIIKCENKYNKNIFSGYSQLTTGDLIFGTLLYLLQSDYGSNNAVVTVFKKPLGLSIPMDLYKNFKSLLFN